MKKTDKNTTRSTMYHPQSRRKFSKQRETLLFWGFFNFDQQNNTHTHTHSTTPFVNHGRLAAQRARLWGPRDPYSPLQQPLETLVDGYITAHTDVDAFFLKCPHKY